MTRRLMLWLLMIYAAMSAADAEARPKRAQMCGGGCTCEQLAKMKEEDRIAFDWCAAKIDQGMLNGGTQWHFECAGSAGIQCCPNDGGQCQWLARPAPGIPQAPLQGNPGRPPARR
jgi:hypothetical protein